MNLKTVSNYVAITLLATPVVWFFSSLWAQVLWKSSISMWMCLAVTAFLVMLYVLWLSYKGKSYGRK